MFFSNNSVKKEFLRNEILHSKNTKCNHIEIIKRGIVSSSNILLNESFKQNEILGLQYIFSSEQTYKSELKSQALSTVLSIDRDTLLENFNKDQAELIDFLNKLSDYCIKLEIHKNILLLPTSLKRISAYLYNESIYQQASTFLIKLSKNELSLYLNIPKRQLSKDLLYLQENNIISYQNKLYTIINNDKLINFIKM